MFDKPEEFALPGNRSAGRRIRPEDERIALRCNRAELQLLDSFVASGEFASRSELMRAALREFVRQRSHSTVASVAPSPSASLEVAVRLRADEVDTYRRYGSLIANGQSLEDTLAQLVRRGDLELKVSELVQRARAQVREASETREKLSALEQTGEDLARRGVVGR